MQEYLSKTERIQNHIKEILADEQKHSTKEIIEYVDSKLKQNGMFVFQINSYVNAAMRLLMASGDYAKVAYGVYQKGGIPYTPNVHERESDLEKTDFRSTMISVKAYAGKIEALFAKKAPFAEMEVKEEAAYWAIKKHSLDVAKSIRENVDKVLRLLDTRQINSRSQAIRKYFEEYMSDKKPHKMNDIKEYIFSCMVKNKEYNGERSTSYIYSAIKNLIEDEGEYQKISRGVYQIRMEHMTTLKKGEYCKFCKGTFAKATKSLEVHQFTETVDAQLSNNRFLVEETCTDCGFETSEYVVAKSVVTSYYGTADGDAHTVEVADLSENDVTTRIRYGTEAGNCNRTSAPNFTTEGYHTVYYEIDYIYSGETMTENGVGYVWLLPAEDEEDNNGTIIVLPQAHEHDYHYLETVKPSCDTLGYDRFQCNGCGDLIKTNYVQALGHNYGEILIREATCKQNGVELHMCKSCGDYYEESTPLADHDYEKHTHDATCRTVGYDEYTCKVCGDNYIYNIKPMFDRTYLCLLSCREENG